MSTPERSCVACRGAGRIGMPGAPCPFCKSAKLSREYRERFGEGITPPQPKQEQQCQWDQWKPARDCA